jgi:hypothetical protein
MERPQQQASAQGTQPGQNRKPAATPAGISAQQGDGAGASQMSASMPQQGQVYTDWAMI